MDGPWSQLDSQLFTINDTSRKLAQKVQAFSASSNGGSSRDTSRHNSISSGSNGRRQSEPNAPQPLVPQSAPSEVQRLRQNLLASTATIQDQLRDPSDFLRQLTVQAQLLACLHWLAYHQVLACIPLNTNVGFKDVAELAGVPEAELSRIVRMTATVGFLCEPEPLHVAHSALSAQFVLKPSLVDAVMFTAEVAAPVSLAMPRATSLLLQRGQDTDYQQSAYNIAFNTTETLAAACEQRGKLNRQYTALDRQLAIASDEDLTSLLSTLSWSSLGQVTVVETGAASTALASSLAAIAPNLNFVVQLRDTSTFRATSSSNSSLSNGSSNNGTQTGLPPSFLSSSTAAFSGRATDSRIQIEQRVPGSAQGQRMGAIYILHLAVLTATDPTDRPNALIIAELKAHFCMLRKNPTAMLIIVGRLLPEPGSVDADIEAVARGRDLAMYQMANLRELEVKDMYDLVSTIQDKFGRLLIVNKLVERRNPIVALEVRYQTFPQHSVNVNGNGNGHNLPY